LLVKNVVFLFVRAQTAESGPPLGTILGNLGINAVKFCNEFNEFTKELPSYFLLKVKILILEDRSYNFFIFPPTTGFIMMFVKTRKKLESGFNKTGINIISLKNVIQLAKYKFPKMNLRYSLPIILGSVNSGKLKVDF
jgi:large subunit ribosomal protein L11